MGRQPQKAGCRGRSPLRKTPSPLGEGVTGAAPPFPIIDILLVLWYNDYKQTLILTIKECIIMNKRMIAGILALSLLLTGCGPVKQPDSTPETTAPAPTEVQQITETNAISGNANANPGDITYLPRPSLLSDFNAGDDSTSGSAQWQTPAADLSNVYIGDFYLDNEQKRMLGQNGFVLTPGWNNEYFEIYEHNRYANDANYITTDSMMHTYHLYFAHLLKKLEKTKLSAEMLDVSRQMRETSLLQYSHLKGTEWEDAAKITAAFFTVGEKLLDPDASVSEEVSDAVNAELSLISAASGIGDSAIFPDVKEDYSQYKPRGYYDSSEDLQRYFKAMMWYGRMGFRQDNDTLNRASVLITLGLTGDALEKWSEVYTVTSFFAGQSDDFGYYEEKPVVDAVYGKDCVVESLVGQNDAWEKFKALCKQLPQPQINSVPVYAADSDEEQQAAQKGFRFMGQRFSIDEACFTQLCYRQVKENDLGEKRLLPDALDFPAALGSDTALSILDQQGSTNYPNYGDQMQTLRTTVHNAPLSTWTANLYSSWIYTLTPLLQSKGDIYPPFMQTDAWRKRSLLTFEGSYTELKHDTILYSKQMMGEMGGGEIPEWDDRGFVEVEPVVFARLKALVASTSAGLSGYGMLDAADKENLNILAELSGKLETIAKKELAGELPTDEEFELIRSFGGQLEHFWEEVMRAEHPEEEYYSPQEHPAALIADIATDPNGWCLEVGTGRPMEITVVVQVDGQLKIASGAAYSFYQFQQPMDHRLTDLEWQQMLGIAWRGDEYPRKDKSVKFPDWYSDILYIPDYYDE